jgi:hypothetical protein
VLTLHSTFVCVLCTCEYTIAICAPSARVLRPLSAPFVRAATSHAFTRTHTLYDPFVLLQPMPPPFPILARSILVYRPHDLALAGHCRIELELPVFISRACPSCSCARFNHLARSRLLRAVTPPSLHNASSDLGTPSLSFHILL